ncbi:MAG: hypothetical protein KDE27_11400 [Planctomycetes bacterium]|nr:hypothetical protein [Planctomycetota bacterium]
MRTRECLRNVQTNIQTRLGYLAQARQGAGVPAIYDEEARALREVLGSLAAIEEALTEDMISATPLRVPAMLERFGKVESRLTDLESRVSDLDDQVVESRVSDLDDQVVDYDDEDDDGDWPNDYRDVSADYYEPAMTTLPDGNEAQRAREILAKRKAATPIDDRDPAQLHETIDGLRHRIRDLESQRDMLSGKVQRLTNPGRESHDLTPPSK